MKTTTWRNVNVHLGSERLVGDVCLLYIAVRTGGQRSDSWCFLWTVSLILCI